MTENLNQHFLYISAQCNVAEEVACVSPPQCPAEGISYLPVSGTCTDYIKCISGQAYEQTCASGTEFSPEVGSCVLEENYECPFNRYPK